MPDLQSELIKSGPPLASCSVWHLLEVLSGGQKRYKYCVHLGLIERTCYYLLTTSRYPKIPRLQNDYFFVAAGTYKFWKKGTWIDCTELRSRKKGVFEALMASGSGNRYCGQLSEKDVGGIIAIVEKSRVLSSLDKQMILQCIR